MKEALRNKLKELEIENIDEIINKLEEGGLLEEACNSIDIIGYLEKKGIVYHKSKKSSIFNTKSIEENLGRGRPNGGSCVNNLVNSEALNRSSLARENEENHEEKPKNGILGLGKLGKSGN